jgi:hypothetical protein
MRGTRLKIGLEKHGRNDDCVTLPRIACSRRVVRKTRVTVAGNKIAVINELR